MPINIPGIQNELAMALKALNKPLVTIVFSGRPLELGWYAENSDAILQAWFLGNESGSALASILFGDSNPSAKLAMFSHVPIYYNQYNNGRPSANGEYSEYRSCYIDVPNYPLYPFDYGLSYSQFEYKKLLVNNNVLAALQQLMVSVEICNISDVGGEEIVQLYIACKNFSVVRPNRELKRFTRLLIPAKCSRIITFVIDESDLAYYNAEMKLTPENRDYIIYVGSDSNADLSAEFSYKLSKYYILQVFAS